ncbi:hypothetical protein [uncultured Alistipes sp.]|uniref:hypothetical protein n=1 Tax=uncultured Alistipes sp. TaxID=538949 RepID=UPI00322016A4
MQKFLLFAFALLAFSACNDSDSDEIRFATENTAIADGSLTGINLHFLGTSVATAPDGTAYTDSSARFEFAGGSEKLTLYMHGTRFAAAMPALKMRLFNVPYTPGEGAALSFLLPTVVPDVYLSNAVGGGYSYQPLPAYTLTNVEGSIDGIDCRVAFSCNVPKLGAYRVEYQGKLLAR